MCIRMAPCRAHGLLGELGADGCNFLCEGRGVLVVSWDPGGEVEGGDDGIGEKS